VDERRHATLSALKRALPRHTIHLVRCHQTPYTIHDTGGNGTLLLMIKSDFLSAL
jgi:hypothetical protein